MKSKGKVKTGNFIRYTKKKFKKKVNPFFSLKN
jgi:hypothetical protein